MSTINIAKQIEELKNQITLFGENDPYGTNGKIVRELIDSLTVIEITERKIDEIIHRAEQRVRKR